MEKNQKSKAKFNIFWNQVIIGIVIGIILGVGGTFLTLRDKITRMDEQLINLEERIKTIQRVEKIPVIVEPFNEPIEADPSKLSEFIKNQQNQNVKTSFSETNCFTDLDLQSFKKERKPEQIVNKLMHDNTFIDLVIAIKNMNPSDRQKLLETNSQIAKPTWRELGSISKKGQTDAGKEAELLIAKAIVSKIKKLMKLSIDELKKKYDQ